MEAEEQKGLLSKVKPPRLEEAGLEDCALPPELIKEAFFKAANSIRSSWATHDIDDDEGQNQGCVEDPKDAKVSDALIGIAPTSDPVGPCGNEVGGRIPEVLVDEVAVGISGAQIEEGNGGGDGFEVSSEEGKRRACVDDGGDGESEEEEEEEEEMESEGWPVLTEGFV